MRHATGSWVEGARAIGKSREALRLLHLCRQGPSAVELGARAVDAEKGLDVAVAPRAPRLLAAAVVLPKLLFVVQRVLAAVHGM
jgi:hypothetical protein